MATAFLNPGKKHIYICYVIILNYFTSSHETIASLSSIMKEHCPNHCEDYASSVYVCEDDVNTDCDSLLDAGLCDPEEAQELTM